MHFMSDDDALAGRLRDARKLAGYESASAAARAHGWTVPTYSSHENTTRGIKRSVLAKYAKAFRVRPAWLMTGEGSPRAAGAQGAPARLNQGANASRPSTDSGDDAVGDSVQQQTPTPSPGDLVGMSFVAELDVRITAGPGSLVEINEDNEPAAVRGYYGFPQSAFHGFGARPEDVRIIEVIGDSMVPTLFPGQRVMVHLQDRRASPPGIFVLWDGLGQVIKRVEYIANSDPPTVRISSDNKAYEPYQRLVDEAHILGRVISAWGRM
jgi:phage repressor protein C with HTH and peptisase S24 domain